jgi:TonB family protein
MNLRSTVFLSLLLLLPGRSAFANKKSDEEAALLFAHARQLSDIRADGAPAFRLKLALKITDGKGTASEGTYTEVWVSRAQWRREIVLGDFHRTVVALERKQWLADEAGPIPENAKQAAGLTSLDDLRAGPAKSAKIKARDMKGIAVLCVMTAFGGKESGPCFDSSSGTLAARETPSTVGLGIADRTCLFEQYQAFGDRLMPTSYKCIEDKKVLLEASMVELTFRPELDQSMFAPLKGAKESVHCPGSVVPPKAVHQEGPEFPSSERGPGAATVAALIAMNGKATDFEVLSSTNKDFAQAAIESVRKWRFTPATCDGEAFEVRITVEVDFRRE